MAYSKRKARRRPKYVSGGDAHWKLKHPPKHYSWEDLWNRAESRTNPRRQARAIIRHEGFNEVIYMANIFTTLDQHRPPSTLILNT